MLCGIAVIVPSGDQPMGRKTKRCTMARSDPGDVSKQRRRQSAMVSNILRKLGEPGNAKRKGMPLSLLLTGWYTTASFLVVAIATGLLYFGLATNLRKISEQ